MSLDRATPLDAKDSDGRRPPVTVATVDEKVEEEDGEKPGSFPGDWKFRSVDLLSCPVKFGLA